MLNDVNSKMNNNLAGLSANLLSTSQNANVAGVSNVLKNAYNSDAKKTDLVDQGQISDEAIQKYEAEKEIAYYKDLLVQMLGAEEPKSDNVLNIMKQVQGGTYNANNSDLATSMLSNQDALDLLA